MKEIEIAGGGLAGLALGIALRRRGVPVTVREAGSYPRHRVCGEFINGVTVETLENLGIAGIFKDALRHRSTRWWMGERKILEAGLSRPALGMSRWEMDERLGREFEDGGGVLQTRTRVKPVAREGLVWAAGRHLDKGSPLLGLKGHFEGLELAGFLEMHIGEGAYVGLTPVTADGSRVNVCGLFPQGARGQRGNPLIEATRACGLAHLAERLEAATMDPPSLTGISGLALGQQTPRDELLTLGDAERMIPPFTGNGMSMAFEAAESAVEPLADYAAGKSAWWTAREKVEQSLRERFQARIKLALLLHQALTKAAGRAVLTAAAVSGVLPFAWLHRRLS